jgi:hypothetical protein
MPRQQLDLLTGTLALHSDVPRGRPPRLAFPEQILATVLHLQVALAVEPLAVLFDSSRTAVHRTLLKNRRLLKTHGIVIPLATTPPVILRVLQARVIARTSEANNKIKSMVVRVHYVGVTFESGKEFDASCGRREIIVPPRLGYGNRSPSPLIPAGSTLVFVVDLLDSYSSTTGWSNT